MVTVSLYSDGASPTGSGEYEKGSTVTISVPQRTSPLNNEYTPENPHYEFVGWQNPDCNTISSSHTVDIQATANVELTAVDAKASYPIQNVWYKWDGIGPPPPTAIRCIPSFPIPPRQASGSPTHLLPAYPRPGSLPK